MAEKEHHLTRAKRLREEAAALAAVEWSVASIPDAPVPVAPVVREEYRIMSKRGDIVDYASSREEAQEKVKEWGYIVKV